MITQLLALDAANDERTVKPLPVWMDALVHSPRLRHRGGARYHRSGSPRRRLPTRSGVIWGQLPPARSPTLGSPALDPSGPVDGAPRMVFRAKTTGLSFDSAATGLSLKRPVAPDGQIASRHEPRSPEPSPAQGSRPACEAPVTRLGASSRRHSFEVPRSGYVRHQPRCVNTTGSTSSRTRCGRSRGPSRSVT